MKKITIAIIICAAVFIIFGALSAWVLSTYDFSKDANGRSWNFGNFFGWRFWNNVGDWENLEERTIDKTLEAEGINFSSVTVSSVSSNISVTKGDKITARLYGDYASMGEIDLVMSQSGGSLTFRVEYPNNMGTFRSNLKLDVTIPAAYAGKLDLNTVSGEISTTLGNDLDGFNASTTSGDVRCGDITADAVKFGTVSGDVYAGTLNVSDKVISNTTSGELQIEMLNGALDAGSVSGDIRANINASGSCKVNTTSGSATIGVPQNAGIDVDYNTVSGDFESGMALTFESSSRNSFKGYTDKDGADITVSTVSGDFDLNTVG